MLPSANEKDLREIPVAVREHVRLSFVATMDEVLETLLLPLPEAGLADEESKEQRGILASPDSPLHPL
jgi:ATP-dependent Lon protease